MAATDTPCHNGTIIGTQSRGKTAPKGYFAVIQLKKPAVMVKGTGQNVPSLESRCTTSWYRWSQLSFWLEDTWLVANTGSTVRDPRCLNGWDKTVTSAHWSSPIRFMIRTTELMSMGRRPPCSFATVLYRRDHDGTSRSTHYLSARWLPRQYSRTGTPNRLWENKLLFHPKSSCRRSKLLLE